MNLRNSVEETGNKGWKYRFIDILGEVKDSIVFVTRADLKGPESSDQKLLLLSMC